MKTFKLFLTEGEGLTNRRPGETFTDEKGQTLTFQRVEFFKTKEDFTGDFKKIIFVNKPLSNLTSLGIVVFKNESGEEVIFGKYLKPGTKSWENNNPGFFKYKSKATAKEESGLKPTDIFKSSSMENLTPEDILDKVTETFGEESPLVLAVQETIDKGFPQTPIVLGDMSETGVTNYFAEILQPIAIMKGIYTGNAGDGISVLAGTDDLSGFKINFPKGQTQGLYDSYLTSGGAQLNISSKFGSASQSAKASVSNLYKIYRDYKDKEYFEEYSDEIEVMRIVAQVSNELAPIEIAKLFSLLKKTDVDILKKLKTDPTVKLSKTITQMRDSIAPGAGKQPDPYYHVIAGIAKTVCKYVNENTRFSEAASLLLNGTVIQVYTKVTTKPGVVTFKQFDTKWPDSAVTNVLIESGTRYKTNHKPDGALGYIVKSK
jgi:hypothetical protein